MPAPALLRRDLCYVIKLLDLIHHAIITLLNARLLLLADLNVMFGIPKVIPQIASPVFTNKNGTINSLICKITFQYLLLPINKYSKMSILVL